MTLVSADEWHKLPHADNIPDGDTVWGVVYRIDPQYAEEVKEYLDHREKDGYTCQEVDVYDHKDGSERLVMQNVSAVPNRLTLTEQASLTSSQVKVRPSPSDGVASLDSSRQVYVGRFDNPSFTGPEQLDDLVRVIHRSVGRARSVAAIECAMLTLYNSFRQELGIPVQPGRCSQQAMP